MNGQKLLEAPIPWYRTRWFWGIIIGLAILWGLYSFFILLPAARNLTEWLFHFSYAFGAGPFGLLGFKLGGSQTSDVFSFLYFLVMLFLVYKTFMLSRVNIIYPILFILLFVFGSWVGLGYLSGL